MSTHGPFGGDLTSCSGQSSQRCVLYATHALWLFARQWISRPPFSHLVGHQVGEQHHVPPVNAHAVVDHRVLDLIDDGCPGSLNAQSLLHLERRLDVSGGSLRGTV